MPPPLPSHGPYFAFLTPNGGGSILTLLGANGQGRADLLLDRSDQIGSCFKCILSPDGRWLAYWTGTAGDFGMTSPPEPLPPGHYDLQLNLMHLPDGARSKVASLLSPDYPDIFSKNAEILRNEYHVAWKDAGWIPIQLQYTFFGGIKSAAWSPDGRYLAFAGEMDGLSSDLYAYDTFDKSIRRLSSGSSNIFGYDAPIGWSPDGRWIVYTSAYITSGINLMVHAARPDGSEILDFPEAASSFSGWISNSEFLTYLDDNGIGQYQLESGNLETGGTTVVWKCPFKQFIVDPQKAAVVYQEYPGPKEWGCEGTGLFYITSPGATPRLLVGADEVKNIWQMEYLNQPGWRFLFSSESTGILGVSASGKTSHLAESGSYAYVSPDRERVAFSARGLQMMDPSGKISDPLTEHSANVSWRPDSQGLIFNDYTDLYILSTEENSITKLEGIDSPTSPENIYWQPDSAGCFYLSGSRLEFLSLSEMKAFLVQTLSSPTQFQAAWLNAS